MKRVKLMKNNKEYAMNSKGDTGDKGDKGDIGAGAYETYKSLEGNEDKTKEEFLSELLYNDYKSIEGNEDKTKEEILYDLGYQCYLSIEGNENKTKEDFITEIENKTKIVSVFEGQLTPALGDLNGSSTNLPDDIKEYGYAEITIKATNTSNYDAVVEQIIIPLKTQFYQKKIQTNKDSYVSIQYQFNLNNNKNTFTLFVWELGNFSKCFLTNINLIKF